MCMSKGLRAKCQAGRSRARRPRGLHALLASARNPHGFLVHSGCCAPSDWPEARSLRLSFVVRQEPPRWVAFRLCAQHGRILLTKVSDATSVNAMGYRESIALFICPLDPEASRVWFRLAVADCESPDGKLREFQQCWNRKTQNCCRWICAPSCTPAQTKPPRPTAGT